MTYAASRLFHQVDRIDESLLYRYPGGGFWLSDVCTLDLDAKGRMVVARASPRNAWAPGEKGPGVQTAFAGTKP